MRKTYAGIDYFRLAAAFMVIGIHIGPFSVWNEDLDYLITYCAGRVAVPFFLMTTGYFVLAPCVKSGFRKKQALHRYLVKNVTLYLAATLFYAPLILYAGNLPHSIPDFFKNVLFDGTFYHLWYFPAAMTGCILLMFLLRKSVRTAIIFSITAYVAGLLGDSYYGLTEQVPFLDWIYSGIFSISSYTRNGIFYAPVFLLMGMTAAFPDERYPENGRGQSGQGIDPYKRRNLLCLENSREQLYCESSLPVINRRVSGSRCMTGLIISFTGMLMEGYITYRLHLQRHNSMYLMLLPVMYFLFQILLTMPGKAPGWIRNSSMLLYILHPTVIVLLRGFAKIVGLTELLTENTFVQYLAVCALSLAFAAKIHCPRK